MQSSRDIVNAARELGIAVPAFNAPYLPMMEPIIRAIVETDAFAFVEVARVEWMKFEAKSTKAAIEEYRRWSRPEHVRLHLDHVPVIDEDGLEVDYQDIIEDAVALGYDSVMVDGSRLDLAGNIEATRQAVEIAHRAGVACEAELGAVLGHSNEVLPPYEELFRTGKGFTDLEEAREFVAATQCDWLSVAVGNIHGSVSMARRDEKKVEARLNLDHLEQLYEATGIPLVLHGGSGIPADCVREGIRRGIAKVNVGTDIRQAYESALRTSSDVTVAQEQVCERTIELITDYFGIAGTRTSLLATCDAAPPRASTSM